MDYSSLTDDELLSLANISDYAEEELLSRYKKLVKQISRSYFLIGAENEDLLQEGMIGLHLAIKSYKKENGCFRTFAAICIKRRIVTAVKSANRQKNKILNDSLSLTEDGGIKSDVEDKIFIIPSSSPSPDENLTQKEDYAKLQTYINENLSKYEKKVLDLYLKGHSYNEIALNLASTSKSVENALTRIRLKLSKYEK